MATSRLGGSARWLVPLGVCALACGTARPPAPATRLPGPAASAARASPDEPGAREAARASAEHGLGMLELGKLGNYKLVEEAKAPLQECLRKDPTWADCYAGLGEALELTDDEPGAAERYGQAIAHDPQRADFYQRLAELYARFRRDTEAEQVVREALKWVAPLGSNARARFQLFVTLARLVRHRHDGAEELKALDEATVLVEAAPNELLVPVAVSYLTPESGEPLGDVRKRTAISILVRLSTRVCREERLRLIHAQARCDEAQQLLQRFGEPSRAWRRSSPPPSPRRCRA